MPLVSASNKQGFTLIELLVVVLIIGILASVALPQYQFAIDKSRAAELGQAWKTFLRAETAYKLANGTYTTYLDELDIDFSAMKEVTSNPDKKYGSVTFCKKDLIKFHFTGTSGSYFWDTCCVQQNKMDKYKQLCAVYGYTRYGGGGTDSCIRSGLSACYQRPESNTMP